MSGPTISRRRIEPGDRSRSDRNYVRTTPGRVEWWGILSHDTRSSKLGDKYMGEMNMLAVVLSLIVSATYPNIFVALTKESSITDNLFVFFTNLSFLSALAGLCLVISVFLQLNLSITHFDMQNFFTSGIKLGNSLTLPLLIGLFTQITLFSCMMTCILWSYAHHTSVMRVVVITLTCVVSAFTAYINIGWEGTVSKEMEARLAIVKSRFEQGDPLIALLDRNGLGEYAGG
jgi:hypothetical protein